MTRDTNDRGTCAVCGRRMTLRRNGTIRSHGREKDTGDRWSICAGTGTNPTDRKDPTP